MKTCYLVVVLLLLSVASHGIRADICDSCECQPPDTPLSVSCVCRPPQRGLIFKAGDFSTKFEGTRNFTISSCDSLFIYQQNLFSELRSLDTLEIQNVKFVIFEMGIFQTLNHLKLRNISILNFKTTDNALPGIKMRSVEIQHSDIINLPKYAIHNISSLEKFDLFNVHIGNIQSEAILLKDSNAVSIVNTRIDRIASNAIAFHAKSIIIFDSILKKIGPAAVKITAKDQLVISKTYFDEKLPNNPVIANAPIVNVSNNVFKRLTPQIISNFIGESNGNMLFMNNTIENIDSDTPINIPSSRWHISGNQFKCTCDMLKILVNFKNTDITENNYCLLTKCRVHLSQGEDKCERQSPANLEDTDICDGVPTVVPLQPQEGRRTEVSTQNYNGTTQLPFVSTTPKSSASIQVVSTFLTCSFIALILL